MSNIPEKEPSDLFDKAYDRLKKSNKLKVNFITVSSVLFIIALIFVIIMVVSTI